MVLKNALVKDRLCHIAIEQGKIANVYPPRPEEGIDLQGRRVIPGLIDTHLHGGDGFDTMDGKWEEISRFLAKNGTTTWLPTTMSADIGQLTQLLSRSTQTSGAQIVGFHLEGPYLCPDFKGAHDGQWLKSPDIDELNAIPNVKKITVAPELPGCLSFIDQADCMVSLGHTGCNYETAMQGFAAGATGVTHLFNAMPSLHHRAPGLIGAAVEQRAYAELICDGIHVHKAAVLAAYGMFGRERMVLISDSIRATGLADGNYELGGQPVIVKDGTARLEDGTIAGSTRTLWQCVKTAVSFGIPFDDAVAMATETPAAALGLNKGRIQPGYDADLLVLTPDDTIETVIIGGRIWEG